MSKRPAFQFYPSDWRTDQDLRMCSSGARGLWIDMLCLMHDGEPYGHLATKGKPMASDVLGRLVGEATAQVRRWIAELREHEVFSETDDGVIYSRRMVRDERLREVRAAGGIEGAEHGSKGGVHGSKGGRPRKPKGGSGDDERGDKKPPLNPPPSSSSSSPASPEGSEDKSSAAFPAPDYDRLSWDGAVQTLVDRCGLNERSARAFFGRLLSVNGLKARDLLPAIAAAQVNGTSDPQAYLTKAAEGVARRRAIPEKKATWV